MAAANFRVGLLINILTEVNFMNICRIIRLDLNVSNETIKSQTYNLKNVV
jgi:hypothetical protein